MATARKLAGVRWLLVSEHRFKKEKHRDEEELTTISSKRLVGSERERRGLAAERNKIGHAEIRTPENTATRARFHNLDAKREPRGLPRAL
jgi:hypothetical protein